MKKAVISRTIVRNVATVKRFNMDTAALEDVTLILPAHIDTIEKCEKYIRKNESLINGKLVMVSAVEKAEKLVGMYVDDFIRLASPVAERSKETRGTVTKTVQSCIGTALYMDEHQKVAETTVTFPIGLNNVDAYVRKNVIIPGIFITVKNVETVESLYSMDEATFIRNARPMKNKFTLDD